MISAADQTTPAKLFGHQVGASCGAGPSRPAILLRAADETHEVRSCCTCICRRLRTARQLTMHTLLQYDYRKGITRVLGALGVFSTYMLERSCGVFEAARAAQSDPPTVAEVLSSLAVCITCREEQIPVFLSDLAKLAQLRVDAYNAALKRVVDDVGCKAGGVGLDAFVRLATSKTVSSAGQQAPSFPQLTFEADSSYLSSNEPQLRYTGPSGRAGTARPRMAHGGRRYDGLYALFDRGLRPLLGLRISASQPHPSSSLLASRL